MMPSRQSLAIWLALVVAGVAALFGACDASPEPPPTHDAPAGDTAAATPSATDSGAAGSGPVEPAAPGGSAPTGDRPAVAGVGRQGQDYALGPVSTPLGALWTTQQRLAFLQLAGPMNLYHAEHGHFPKTERELFEKIVRANAIRLPELPEGQRYVYDARRAERMTQYDPEDPPLRVAPVDSAAGQPTP